MAAGRTLHVRCMTWEQVEQFYTRKLRRGKLLSMRVPFRPEIGAQVTLGLELPNQVVIAVDGRIQKTSPMEGDAGKTWIEIELAGFTDEVIARIKTLMASAKPPEAAPSAPSSAPPSAPGSAPGSAPPSAPIARAFADGSADLAASSGGRRRSAPSRPPPPSGHELPADEKQLFLHLTGELRRLRQLAVHEILGVDRDADADEIRLGWMRLVRRYHPDLVARHHAAAISHLAEELTILCNRAYDRLRAALVLEGRATSAGSVLQQPAGWLVGFDEIESRESSSRVRIDGGGAAPQDGPGLSDEMAELSEVALPSVMVDLGLADADPADPPSVVKGGETFELRARLMLSNGEAAHAQEVLAAALCVYPRSRPLRSLYYVASALAALMKGERMLATSQLETALAHYEHCVEAAQILEYMRRNTHADHQELRRFFR